MAKDRNIKNLKPNFKSRYKQGYYDVFNPSKYLGPRPIIYRSGLELDFMKWCENSPNIISWTSEPFPIEYTDFLGKSHNYWIDFVVKMRNGTTVLIEVKPSNQVPLNEAQIRMNPEMAKNYAKWKAADQFCKNNWGHKFMVVTEKTLAGLMNSARK